MATYVNDLRLKEITTGDESGTWGTSTNTNLELIAEAFSYGTEVITTNADTHTTTIADGATDPGRSMYLKYTGTLDSACTITIGPNTVSKVWIIENGTSGSQNIIISQGSGADITIPAGDTKVVYSDGAGAGAAFFDAFANLKVTDPAQTNITSVGTLTGFTSTGIDDNADATAITIDSSENVGIGTASPSRKLDVNGSGIVRGFMTLYGTGTDNALFLHNTAYEWAAYTNASNYFVIEDWNLNQKRLVIDTSGNVGIGVAAPTMPLDIQSNSAASAIKIRGRSDDIAEVDFYNNANSSVMARLQVDTTHFATYVDGSERMRIDSSGAVEIGGTTNPTSSKLFVAGGAGGAAEFTGTGIAKLYFGSTEGGGQTWSFQTSGSGNYGSGNGDMYIVNGSATTFMQFDTSASTVVGDFVDTSDVGLKENIVDTTDGLTKLMQLQPRKFDWKKEGKQQQVNGFIAQELETVLPNEVSGDDYDEENPSHGQKGINTSGVLAVAVKAIQEQQALIESLTARITTLEG
jgi:hypothetical protein